MLGPFEREHADAWASDFVDLETLNARASDQVLRLIDESREAARVRPGDLATRSILLLGPAGSGKTHLFARLRRRAGPRAAFVLLRPQIASDPTPRHVLAACFDALQHRPIGREERQLDVIVGAALGQVSGQSGFPHLFLDALRSARPDERAALIDGTVAALTDKYPEIEADWLARLIQLPGSDPVERRAALTWLSGREPDAGQLSRLGLTGPLPDTTVLPALRTLAILAACSTPLVLVFDQLENLASALGTGRIHAYARLVSELFDTVRGLVIVQLALDAEWDRRIHPELGAAERSRLESRVVPLELPRPEERAALVEAWSGCLPPEQRHPLPWPFGQAEWSRWAQEPGVTPRMLMIACREALAERGHEPSPPPVPKDSAGTRQSSAPAPGAPRRGTATRSPEPEPGLEGRLEELWEEQRAAAREELDRALLDGRPLDPERLLGGLAAALGLLSIPVAPRVPREPQDLRIVAAGEPADLFVAQQNHPRSLSALFEKVARIAESRRVIVVREAARPIPPTWARALEELGNLRERPNACFLEIAPRELADLLALQGLLSAARSQDLAGRDGRPLPEALVQLWAQSSLEVDTWPSVQVLAEGGGAEEPQAPFEGDRLDRRPALARPVVPGPPPPASPRGSAGVAGTQRATSGAPSAPREARGVPERSRAGARAGGGRDRENAASVVLRSLRLLSLDRLVREVRLLHPGATRRSVLGDVRALGDQVRWFGRAILAWHGDR